MSGAATVHRVNYPYPDPQDPFVTSGQTYHQARRKPRRLLVVLLALSVGGVLVTAGVLVPKLLLPALSGDEEKTFDITGDLTIAGSGLRYGTSTGDCVGDGGYADIHDRTTVVVTDAKGTTIAIGSITGEGKARRDSVSPIKPTSCIFAFKVTGVPDGSAFYGVTVGKRGTLQYARDQLNQPIHLTLS